MRNQKSNVRVIKHKFNKCEQVCRAYSDVQFAYCDENIRDVYHELFDEALEKYNAKQTRADRVIDDYYEKIRFGKQEKTVPRNHNADWRLGEHRRR